MSQKLSNLPYNLKDLKREEQPYYISLTQEDIQKMLSSLGKKELSDLYQNISSKIRFEDNQITADSDIPEQLSYEQIIEHVQAIADKNNRGIDFIGDALPHYKTHPIVNEILSIRGLTTCYTPYQPEKSQGTLIAHWIYQSVMYHLTGFEAVNASLYDRSTALYEAILTATRIQKKKNILALNTILPQDKKVLQTLSKNTDINIIFLSLPHSGDKPSGTFSIAEVKNQIKALEQNQSDKMKDISALVFPQVNSFGALEDVDGLTDIASELNLKSIAIIDPILLAEKGLKAPSDYGKDKKGADIIVGEGQHLAISSNFGGPGLGIMGIRHNAEHKNDIRFTAGRYVGDAKDISGRSCKVAVLSTREQHIRRDKANSNICSNQAFISVLAGASTLAKGNEGLAHSCEKAKKSAEYFCQKLHAIDNVKLAYPNDYFFNEITLRVNKDVDELIEKASQYCAENTGKNLWLGVNVSQYTNAESKANNLLKISFSDLQTEEDIEALISFLEQELGTCSEADNKESKSSLAIPPQYLRQTKTHLPKYSLVELVEYYKNLGDKNTSPDEGCYPLGSCTMKYNPYLNDYLASLENFQMIHPQAPLKDVQGCLEIIYHNQEYFKVITGLPYITTQPVAGAQGELVGLKLFQAYHNSKNQKRDIVLIPHSAHGTNPATATYAGYTSNKVDEYSGIHLIEATEKGSINMTQLEELITKYHDRIAGIMITNPNTSGIFENDFESITQKIHGIDGLVYMDGANMNAIAGWIDLQKMGVDAVHNNVHKTWSIPHGGGGPGDAFVAVSEKLKDFLPGQVVEKREQGFHLVKANQSIGEFHRHFGNFAHKVRSYSYLLALGINANIEGVKKMSAVAVLSANYIKAKIKDVYEFLPYDKSLTSFHEFIITLSEEDFEAISQQTKLTKAKIITRVGKLFLDFGFHAPTVAFPEPYGLMIEPTESFSLSELDHFIDVLLSIKKLITTHPSVLLTAPHFTCINLVDEVSANKNIKVSEKLTTLPEIHPDQLDKEQFVKLSLQEIERKIVELSENRI